MSVHPACPDLCLSRFRVSGEEGGEEDRGFQSCKGIEMKGTRVPFAGRPAPIPREHSTPEGAHRCPPSPAALARREEESLAIPTKRRRVTAEMEGKYIINMPKGTTPRTRKILEQQQAAKGTACRGTQGAAAFPSAASGRAGPTGVG